MVNMSPYRMRRRLSWRARSPVTLALAVAAVGVGCGAGERDTRVVVSPDTVIIAGGTVIDLSAKKLDVLGHAIENINILWTTMDSMVATVSAAGRVRGVTPGTTSVLAEMNGRKGAAVVSVMNEDQLPSLSRDVQPILTSRCATAGCHAGPKPPFHLDLARGGSYTNLVNAPAVELKMKLVTPYLPRNSYLLFELRGEGREPGTGIPHAHKGLQITNAEIAAIRNWILAGANNN